MCVSVCVCVNICACVCVHMCVCVCVHVCVPEYLCVYMFECVDMCVHVWGRGVQPRVCMLVGVSISLLDCVC